MSMRLKGKTAVVTAAAQGIGRATALAFAAEGAQVYATDLNAAKLAEIVGPGIRTLALDVRDTAAVQAAAEAIGAVDILFNCAGFVHQGSVLEATEAEWDFAFDLNVNRAIYGASKAAVIGLTKSIAADYATKGVRCNAICPGTVQSPSLDDRIAANAAAAGSLEAARAAFIARQPMGRLGRADEIAALAVYLASEDSVFVTGQALVIDGGISL
jgi:2-keto-3-deoxy-L-fuconate dehydrogenase